MLQRRCHIFLRLFSGEILHNCFIFVVSDNFFYANSSWSSSLRHSPFANLILLNIIYIYPTLLTGNIMIRVQIGRRNNLPKFIDAKCSGVPSSLNLFIFSSNPFHWFASYKFLCVRRIYLRKMSICRAVDQMMFVMCVAVHGKMFLIYIYI